MNFYERQVVFQEVPNEISLAYSITGCKMKCKGCHSPFTWNVNGGQELNEEQFNQDLEKYSSLVSCVLFFGGEWHSDQLVDFLAIARHKYNLKTCLYTGLDTVPDDILDHLTYVKTGYWDENLGGLQSPTTNQTLINLINGESLNHHFIR